MLIHSYHSESQGKDPAHETGGKHVVTFHGAPRGRKAYKQWGTAWFPKGIVYDTAITTSVPCSLRHDAFNLAWADQRPVCLSV
jgi:hypothetical protein